MVCAGAVRLKNVQNSMMKNLLDACGAAVAFYFVGYAFAFGGQDGSEKTTFLGSEGFASVGESPAFWFFQYTFSATSVTIVSASFSSSLVSWITSRLMLIPSSPTYFFFLF